jgi:hypothetical protein
MPARLNFVSASSRLLRVCAFAAALIVVACLTIAVCGANVRSWFLPYGTVKSPATAAHKQQTTPKPSGPGQMIRFIIYDVGIQPRETRVDKGRVTVMIEDLSGGTDGLQIERLNGDEKIPVGSVRRFERRTRGQAEFLLEPGEYRVSDISHPANSTKLIVEP